MREECLRCDTDCKYFDMPPPPELRATQEHGGFVDTDHLISQRLAYDALSRYVINRPENKKQTCRQEHDEKNKREAITGVDDYPLPDEESIRQIILNDIEAGRQVPRSVRRQLRRDREQIAQRRAEVLSNFWSNLEERRA